MPKRTYKIEEFHGGINSNSDPRDIKENQSPSLIDANIDKIGRLTLLGSSDDSDTTLNHSLVIKPNQGLFVMNSDRRLDGTASDESLIFVYNYDDHKIDGIDSAGISSDTFSSDLINTGNISPIYHSVDGALRVADKNLSRDSRFFGYVEDAKFSSLNSNSGTIGWHDTNSSIEKPTDGNVFITTPFAGSDAATGSGDGLNSSDSEIIGTYANGSNGGGEIELLDSASVNLRVGVQYSQALELTATNWNVATNCTKAENTTNPIPLFGDINNLITGASSQESCTFGDDGGRTFVIDESNSFVIGIWFIDAEYERIDYISILLYEESAGTTFIQYDFGADELVGGQTWNVLSCSTLNIAKQTASFGDTFQKWRVVMVQKDGNTGTAAPTCWTSGPVVSQTRLDGFGAGNYTFWHSYLYDKSKQESLLKKFEAEGSAYTGIEINIVGSPILFRFDLYVNPFSSRVFTNGAGIDVSDDKIISDAHGLVDGDVVKLEGIKRATGISDGTLYYVRDITTNDFKLATSKGGSAVTLGGSDDTLVTGNAQAGASGTITLASDSSVGDDYYNGQVINITSGSGGGQTRVISDYVGSSKVASIKQDWVNTNASDSSNYKIGVTFQKYEMNKRITGSRIYYKLTTNDNHFLIGEVDFVNKGFKWFPESETFAYDLTNTSNADAPVLINTSIVKKILPDSANTVDTYKNINGYSNEISYITAKYKTSVVHGRRVYIGNIKRPDSKTYPDRIVKSVVNKFDVFPEDLNAIDVTINDGESIVKLEAFADRILQFKENSLYIINISENVDFLEDTFRNKGCSKNYHVVKTDYGIAWFNSFGVYFYDGRTVNNLLEKDGLKLINESDWEAFITDGEDGSSDDTDMSSAHIGYIPKKRQLLIKNENKDVFIYDFVLRAWMKGSGRIAVDTNMTNFTLRNEDLIYLTNTDSVIKKWNPSATASTNFVYQTKDIDFGEPGVRKKVYKVRISYKGDADSLNVRYSKNGDTDTLYNFNGTNSDGTPTGSADPTPLLDKTDLTLWSHAELKPATSSVANNIYSFQIHMDGTVDSDFEINDICIVYRMKSIR
tara:strand:- start:18088 stop:21297 length:3210 start_codon:yes stop_codon:yes gene_type:complete